MTSRTVSNEWLPSRHRELLGSEPAPWNWGEGRDQGLMNGEVEAFVEAGADFDHQRLLVGEDGRCDVATDESSPDGVWLPVDFDRSLCIDAPDEGDPSPSQGKAEAAPVISIRSQRERGWESPEVPSGSAARSAGASSWRDRGMGHGARPAAPPPDGGAGVDAEGSRECPC